MPEPANEKDKMRRKTRDYFDLSSRMLGWANKEIPRIAFLEEMMKTLMEFSVCDSIEMWINDGKRYCSFRRRQQGKALLGFRVFPSLPDQREPEWIAFLLEKGVGESAPAAAFRTRDGALWINDIKKSLLNCPDDMGGLLEQVVVGNRAYRSFGLVPFSVREGQAGLLQLRSAHVNHFKMMDADHYEGITQMISIALMNWQIRSALNERIKELTCLYNLVQLSDRPDLSLDEILQGAVEYLPPAWQYPDVASARIIFDDNTFSLPGFKEGKHRQTAGIVVRGKTRGTVEVDYSEEMPDLDEGPFLKEERNLIENIARELSLIIERHLYEEEEAGLLDQLRHADRLSIIGQLSAAVAHELNEPLANILGFVQLVLKSEDLTEQVSEDLEKIFNASLHARKITRKLLSFARQIPPEKSHVNLNHVVEETLYFFESRCTKEGIILERSFSPEIRDIYANSGQLMQVVTNLVVNAMHAMPGGGRLEIGTCLSGDHVSLIIEDSGTGMSEEVKGKIFTPFFTNKSVGHGTGLGLPVVHGIVLAHGGSIRVDSKLGEGTRFEVQFPLSESMVLNGPEKETAHD
jgi:two-component system NtrC family sensor kinase